MALVIAEMNEEKITSVTGRHAPAVRWRPREHRKVGGIVDSHK